MYKVVACTNSCGQKAASAARARQDNEDQILPVRLSGQVLEPQS